MLLNASGMIQLCFRLASDVLENTHYIIRELTKAYVGFVSCTCESSSSNWGCGAFGGDADLKSLIQMMAALAAGRYVAFFAFGDRKLCDSMDEVHKFLREKEVTVGALLEILLGFGRARNAKYNNLNEHIYNSVLSFEDDAASEGEEKKREDAVKQKGRRVETEL
jgi:hypothetical protein